MYIHTPPKGPLPLVVCEYSRQKSRPYVLLGPRVREIIPGRVSVLGPSLGSLEATRIGGLAQPNFVGRLEMRALLSTTALDKVPMQVRDYRVGIGRALSVLIIAMEAGIIKDALIVRFRHRSGGFPCVLVILDKAIVRVYAQITAP